jgi:hypothetical protein
LKELVVTATALPMLFPSTLNWTPLAFVTLTVTVVVPETFAPDVGDVIEMLGGGVEDAGVICEDEVP